MPKLEDSVNREEKRKGISSSHGSFSSDETSISIADVIAILEMKANAEIENRGEVNSFKSPFCVSVGCSEAQSPLPSKFVNKADLGHFTPLTDGEKAESSSLSDQTEESDLVLGCQTPKECIFDPFAYVPDELMFAPKKKALKKFQLPIMRQLDFDSFDDSIENFGENGLESAAEEEGILETVYTSFLYMIMANQVGEFSGESSLVESSSCDLKTPMSLPFLTGIAETCPGAPIRPTFNSRKLNLLRMCRKLEF